MPRERDVGSCAGPATMGGRLGDGQAEEAVEREGEESSSAWHASEQYIRLLEGRNEIRQRGCEGGDGSGTDIYLSPRMGLPH